jgi:hypothetical protein
MPDLLPAKARWRREKTHLCCCRRGSSSTMEVMSRVKPNMERSDCPEATACSRKSRTLSKAILHEKSKILGHKGIKLRTTENIMENIRTVK